MGPSYLERMDKPGPKKLLSLDGGGIRGIISLEVLSGIESMLRSKLGQPKLVLGDYFDYIAGTSTGAIAAAGLAAGMEVKEIEGIYLTHGAEMFDRAALWQRFKYSYRSDLLSDRLQEIFRNMNLGDESLRCLLMMVLRNATTDSPWPLSNNPRAMFAGPESGGNNLALPLWRLVRASTAAPTYFPPEVLVVNDQEYVFVDGGMTMFNNPALQLFLMATLDKYNLRWQSGEDRILIVSVGTGSSAKANDRLRASDMDLLYNAKSIPAALMYAASNQQDMLCRVMGRCLHGGPIDLELGDLISNPDHDGDRAFTYLRYNADLSRTGLDSLGLTNIEPESVQKLDSIDHIRDLQLVGAKLAQQVQDTHFVGFLSDPADHAAPQTPNTFT